MNGEGEFDVVLGFFSLFGENIWVGFFFINLVWFCIFQDIDEFILEYYIFFVSYRMEVEDLDFFFELFVMLWNVWDVFF